MRPLVLLLFLLVGALLAYLVMLWQITGVAEPGIAAAYARAEAYYVNEDAYDYRRARLELLPLRDRLGEDPDFWLDLALLDLQEVNYRVLDERRLFPVQDYEKLLRSAIERLQRADALAPGDESVHYNLARAYIHYAPSAADDEQLRAWAFDLLKPLADRTDADPSALMLLAGLYVEKRDYEQAHAAYARIVGMGEDYVPQTLFRVACFRQADALKRYDREAGIALDRQYRAQFPDKLSVKSGALERGRYTELRPLGNTDAPEPNPRAMNWLELTLRTGVPAGITYFYAPDIDGDCARDLVVNTASGVRLLRIRRDASFSDLTEKCGLPAGFQLHAAAAGDLDADGRSDLVIAGPTGVRVFLNTTDTEHPNDWQFTEAVKQLDGIATRCVVLWDLDHDGDLDLFAGGAPNRCYRLAVEKPPHGGTELVFTDVTALLKMAEPPAQDAVLLDVEQDDDVDLLVTSAAGGAWFENLRQMRFERRDLAAGERIAVFDVDHDLSEEIWIAGAIYDWTDGGWRKLREVPLLIDLDGDGFVESDGAAGLGATSRIVDAVATDLNRDGDRDALVLTEGGLEVYLADPAEPRSWLDVQPRGDKTNKLGIGTRLHLRAGDLKLGATCRDGVVTFPLGGRTQIDSLLAYWTNGVAQGEAAPMPARCHSIDEREGEVGSCPFLYAFDGKAWHFIADCHSGTPLGLPYADGKYLPPRPDETIFVPGTTLHAVDGVVRLDLAEEFRELFYVDKVVLRAIDHPPGVRPVLNEAFRVMKHPKFAVYGLSDLRPPRQATDHKGRDVLAKIARRDGKHAVVWDPLPGQYPGLCYEWSITLDFGDLSNARRVLLVMDGWVEFPTASASIAASQSKTVAFKMPVLEVKGRDGKWIVADPEPGFPAGKGKAVLVDMTGKFHGTDGRVRISSTQRLHWDAFGISTGPDGPLRLTVLPLVRADHGYRGVGVRVEDPAGELPWRYDHDRLETFLRWDQVPAGMLTRYGDVRELLGKIDDRYPVLATGDLVELAFDAGALPALPDGWVRDYCFTTHGWVKDADMNQAVRETVEPLPFRAMSGYPYDAGAESHPHPAWIKEWFTRPSRRLHDPAGLAAQPAAAPGVSTSTR